MQIDLAGKVKASESYWTLGTLLETAFTSSFTQPPLIQRCLVQCRGGDCKLTALQGRKGIQAVTLYFGAFCLLRFCEQVHQHKLCHRVSPGLLLWLGILWTR